MVRNCIHFPLLFDSPSPCRSLPPLVAQAGSVCEKREREEYPSPSPERRSVIMHSAAGFTFNTFLPGLRLMLTVLDLPHNY